VKHRKGKVKAGKGWAGGKEPHCGGGEPREGGERGSPMGAEQGRATWAGGRGTLSWAKEKERVISGNIEDIRSLDIRHPVNRRSENGVRRMGGASAPTAMRIPEGQVCVRTRKRVMQPHGSRQTRMTGGSGEFLGRGV